MRSTPKAFAPRRKHFPSAASTRRSVGALALALLSPVAVSAAVVSTVAASPAAHAAAATPATVANAFGAITSAAVKGTKVDYGAVQAKQTALADVVKMIETASLKGASKQETLAFYLNAYNAHVLAAVLREGLVKDGASTGRGVLDVPGFFDQKTVTTAGQATTLNTLEEKFIRSAGDPRIHFAVNCASVDCPPLAATPYRGKSLDKDLDARSRAYLKRPGAVVFNDATKEVRVVKLFEWYAKDFGGEAGVRKFLHRYLEDARIHTYAITFHEYDWHLNATK